MSIEAIDTGDCLGCAVMRALSDAKRGVVVECEDCDAWCYGEPVTGAGRVEVRHRRAKPLAPLPLPDPIDRDRNAPPREHNARRDMQALAQHPDIRAVDFDRDRGSGPDESPDLEERTRRDRAREAERRRARHGASRLAALRLPTRFVRASGPLTPDGAWPRAEVASPDGARFADVIWYVFGQRGEVLDKRESCAALVADRYARPGERAIYRAWLDRTHKHLKPSMRDAMNAVSFGNALIGAAVAAYEHDDWSAWLPVVAVVESEPSKRERFVAGVVARWAAVRAESAVGAESAPAEGRSQ